MYTTVHNSLVTLVTVRVRRKAERMERIHFDAVRAIGLLGEEIAYEVMQFTDFHAGPIVRSGIGERSMYFLLAPGTAAEHRWPPGVEAMCRNARGDAFVGVPALDGGPGRWTGGRGPRSRTRSWMPRCCMRWPGCARGAP